jgi:hypothetical protein
LSRGFDHRRGCLEGSTTEGEQQGQICFVIGAILNVILNRLNTILQVELTTIETSMSGAQKTTLYLRVLEKMNLSSESLEAQESRFSFLNGKERIKGSLIRPNQAFSRIVGHFFLLQVLPLFSDPLACVSYGSTLSNMLRNISCEKGYDDQLYKLFFATIMEASQKAPCIDLDLGRAQIDEIVDNLVDSYLDYMLKVVVSESVLQLMRALLANVNVSTLSFRHEVLSRIVDIVDTFTGDVNK